MKIVFTRGSEHFEIQHEPARDGFPYAGYVNGVLSITASGADIVARALIKKHIVGLPEAQVVRFPLERRLARSRGASSAPQPDRAG